MAREEILNVLNELEDMNINEIDDLNDSKVIVENEIAKLEEKISDNSNYPVFDYINIKAKIASINKNLTSLNEKIISNNNEIDSLNVSVELFNSDVEKTNAQISETQQQLDDIGKKLHSLSENPNNELEEEYSKDLQEKRENLTALKEELEMCETYKQTSLDDIEKLKDTNKKLNELISRYTKLKENLEKREANKEDYDKSKKRLDENRLSELKSSLDSINNRNNYLNNIQISSLINDIKNNNISSDALNDRLLELKNNIPSTYIENSSVSLENIKERQNNLTMLISNLETKLADEVNYTPSIFATEVYSDEISDYESRIKSYDDEMNTKDLYISRIETVINLTNINITSKEDKIIELQNKIDDLRFEMIDPSYSKQDLDSFTKEISKNKKEIENIRKQIERLNKNISTKETLISSLRKDKKEIENIKNADIKTLDGLKATLEDRKTVDRVSMANDKKQLEVYLSERKILQSLEKFYDIDFDKLVVDEKVEDISIDDVKREENQNMEVILNTSIQPDITTSLESEDIPLTDIKVENQDMEQTSNESIQSDITTTNTSLDEPLESDQVSSEAVLNFDDIEEPTFEMPESSLASDVNSSVINSLEPEPQVIEETKKKVMDYKPASNNLIEKSKSSKFISKVKEKLSAIRFTLAIASVNVKKFASELKNDIHTSISNARNNKPNSLENTKDLVQEEKLSDELDKDEATITNDSSESLVSEDNTDDKELNESEANSKVSETDLMEELNSYNHENETIYKDNDLSSNNEFDYEPVDSVTIGSIEDSFIRNLQQELFGNEEPSMGRSR